MKLLKNILLVLLENIYAIELIASLMVIILLPLIRVQEIKISSKMIAIISTIIVATAATIFIYPGIESIIKDGE